MKIAQYLAILVLFVFSGSKSLFSQNAWTYDRKSQPVFVENQGQFKIKDQSQLPKMEIAYAYDGAQTDFFITKKGIYIELRHQEKRKKSEEEKKARAAKKAAGFSSADEFRAFEEQGHRLKIEEDNVFVEWVGANENVEIQPLDLEDFYYSYTFIDELNRYNNKNQLRAWKKILYKNLYPKIDLLLEIHPVSGYKYSFILHPGSNPQQIQMKYSKPVYLNANGAICMQTKWGEIVDHKPFTFKAKQMKKEVPSQFVLHNGIITFDLGLQKITEKTIIDPWTQMPNFPSSNWDCVWECERDGSGNVYLIGGTSPLQLIKYNAAGALQWTYNTTYDTTEWLGTFATDLAGNSYVSNGSPARIMKINTAGAMVWNNNNPGGLLSLTEFWNITFNCDQTKLVVAGTDGTLSPEPWIFNINLNSGNIINSVQVHNGNSFQIPPNDQEVRSITPANNGKYYFLTHDSIGWIHQSLTSCTQNGSNIFHVNSGLDLGYKCENWRYNNAGIMALAHYNGFIYVHRGNQLQKRNFATAAIVSTVNIPGGSWNTGFGGNSVGCSGIDIDDCGNIYVGSVNAVVKFDQNLNQLASYPTTYNVYDVEVNNGGEIIACGSTGTSGSGARTGYIQSISASACAPQAVVCCDATICPINNLCVTDAALTIQSTSPGGTFSASCGACINAGTGLFNPATAGVGTHTITYILACGSESFTVAVNSCAPISVCQQSANSLAVSGGTGPYTWYAWNPGGSTPITTQAQCTACGYSWFFGQCLNGVFPVTSCSTPAGYQQIGTGTTITTPSNFPIQVVSASGSTITYNSLTSISPCSSCPSISLTNSNQVNPACFGQSTGSFTLNPTAGTGPFNYIVNFGGNPFVNRNGVTGPQTFTNLAAGTYTVSVTDANNCPGTTTITILQPQAIQTNGISQNPLCNGGTTGQINLTVNGGTAPYSFLWSNGATTEDLTGISASNFVVTITDAQGCSSTYSSTLTQPNPISSNVNIVNINCNTAGTIQPNITGGNLPYSYLWSNGATTSNLTSNLPGNYNLTVTDQTNCSVSLGGFTLTQTGAVLVNLDSVRNASCGANDGAVFVSAAGAATYVYLWSNGSTNNSLQNISSGIYQLTVTGNNGCSSTLSNIAVNTSNGPLINLDSIRNVTCFGGSDGGIFISVSNGSPTYNYIWSNGATSSQLSGIQSGLYQLTVTDAAGCSISSVSYTLLDGINNSAQINNVATLCLNTNAIQLTVSGAAGGLWSGSNISSSGLFTPSSTGINAVYYSFSAPCVFSDTLLISVNALDSAAIISPSFCAASTATNLTVIGTTGGSWSGNGITNSVTGTFDPQGVGVGTFMVVYATNGLCPVSDTAYIVVTPNATANIQVDTFCEGENPRTLVQTGTTGGTWSGSGIQGSLTGLFDPSAVGVGNYQVIYNITGACAASDTAVIRVEQQDTVQLTNQVFCINDLAIPLPVVSNNTGIWSGTGITNSTIGLFDPSQAGTGQFQIYFRTGGYCSDLDSAQITVLPLDLATIAEDTFCFNQTLQNLRVIGTPGGIWSGIGVVDSVLGVFDPNGLAAGNYWVYYRTPGNCSVVDSARIVVDQDLNLSAGVLPTLAGDTSFVWGSPFVVSNATNLPGLQYNWSVTGSSTVVISTPNAATTQVNPSDDGFYYFLLQVTSANGCTDTTSVRVNLIAEVTIPEIPTAFSPNADGQNDIFQIVNLNKRWIVEFKVYDRWGQTIYDNREEAAWDGKYKGVLQPRDVYMYTISWQFLNDLEPTTKRGQVTLLR